jgi:hypothetical protein
MTFLFSIDSSATTGLFQQVDDPTIGSVRGQMSLKNPLSWERINYRVNIPAMTLLTAHRILISTAVIFFLGFGIWELNQSLAGGNSFAVIRSLVYLLVGVGFGLYLKFMRFRLK